MDKNIVDNFLEFKINYLVKYGLCFFHQENKKNIKLITEWLERYLNTYINFSFYHILNTLDSVEDFGFDNLNKELEGLKVEILDDYSANELSDSNEDYYQRRKLISLCKEVSYFLVRLDNIKFYENDNIENKVRDFINNNTALLEYIDGNFHNLLSLIKTTNTKINNFFKDNNEFFNIEYKLIDQNKDLYLVNLTSQIKILEINYKKSLVDRVFNDEKLDAKKAALIIQKLSKDILQRHLNDEKNNIYLIKISDSVFYRNKLYIDNLLKNPFINRHLILLVNNSTYINRKKLLTDYNLACLQDFSHINEVKNKLTEIDEENAFTYLIINDFKVKDEEEINKFQFKNIKGIIINREV